LSFYFSKDTFNRISETVLFDAMAVVFAAEIADQIVCVIDENEASSPSYFSANSVSNPRAIGIVYVGNSRE